MCGCFGSRTFYFYRQKGRGQMKKVMVILLVLCLCVGVCACGNDSSKTEVEPVSRVEQAKLKLTKAFHTCCGGDLKYAIRGSDDMSLTLDSKPDDYYYSGEEDAFAAMKRVNSYLGFSTSLWEKMKSTRALDGMQTQSSVDYTVTWTYHPDNGLRVIYEVNP